MRASLPKLLTAVVGILSLLPTLYLLYKLQGASRALASVASPEVPVKKIAGKTPAKTEGKGEEKGEGKAEGKGEGKGEGKAEAKGEGGEGEGKKVESTAAANAKYATLVTMDELFANLGHLEQGSHAIAMKLEIELFDEEDRPFLEPRLPGIKNTIIQLTLEQSFNRLNTLSGKLLFKEQIVSRLNAFFNKGIVRDVHFSSFYLQ
jgi:flagellar basal body-associated protein FliL